MSERAGPKVIYVMGAGHSGSTILGVALGNCSDMFFAGELQNFLRRSGTPVLGGVERTRFWASVRELVPDAGELYGNQAHRLLERSSAPFRLRRLGARRTLRERYLTVTPAIIRAVAATSGSSYVVDTSHFPLRARLLQQLDDVELYLIFLVRDPQPVVASINRLIGRHDARRRRRMTVKTNAELWLTYALSLLVFLRQPERRRLLVRYEDFVAAPEHVLRQILDVSASAAEIPELDSLSTGIAIHANRLINSEVVALKRGGTAAAAGSSKLTALLQRPWASVFARLRPRTGPPGA